MRFLCVPAIIILILGAGCDKKSTSPDPGFPSITVDAYYRLDSYYGNIVYVMVFNDSGGTFHCALEGNIHVLLPETTIVYPDTTVYSPAFPYEAIEIVGGPVTYPDTTIDVELPFDYMHIASGSYDYTTAYFDDNEVVYGYYEYQQYGQTQHDYAFERVRQYTRLNVTVSLRDPSGQTHVYNLTDLSGG